ncbi:ATP-binding protein [Azonexus sp.]|uniref:ATP-binding protein n=1 Tax=Azonexus sp. TaxID=1872668 RepID=UPI0039E55D21
MKTMQGEQRNFLPFTGWTGTLLALLVWTVLTLVSLFTQREQLNRAAAELARIDAVANLKKDMAIRKWASTVEGVFIREKHIPAVNSLEQEERVTAVRYTGQQFTLVSVTPMHLLLAIQGMTNQEFGSRERLTSKQLRNPDNVADEWETKALEELEKGASIVTQALPKKGGHGLMRAMIPMQMEKECLECHRDTLVPVGGLRGGATISIDLNTYRAAQEPTWHAIRIWHGGIWLLGLAVIMLLHRVFVRRAAEFQRQEQLRRENEAAFAAMAEGAVITDHNGDILWVNDAFCQISGYARSEVVGRNPRLLKSGVHEKPFYTALWQQLKREGHWRGEIWNRRKNGEVFPEDLSIQALRSPDGVIRRYISIFSDITQRKKNESELAAYREHLEDLVRQRTEELTVARDAAEAANRSKSIFLANMSHELRTPLNAVIGFSRLMANDPGLSPVRQDNVRIISHSGEHLLTLINDVLELSKIESGSMQVRPEEIDLPELLGQVVDMMSLRAEEGGLRLDLSYEELPRLVLLDPGMLRQILLNLLSNAIKFTPEGSVTLKVKVHSLSAQSARLEFAVCDTGIGIDSVDQARIFSSFEQIGSAHQGGTGLGLTISQRYVELMGGELCVRSQPGVGSEFSFAIVVPVVAASGTLQPRLLPQRLSPLTQAQGLLLLDESEDHRHLLEAILTPLNFAVHPAANWEEAQAVLAKQSVLAVITDWRLPEIGGAQLLKEIARLSPAPVFVLTADALLETRQAALDAGAAGFLCKPLSEPELHCLLAQVLSLPLAEDALPMINDVGALSPQDYALLEPPEREQLTQAALTLNPEAIERALSIIAARLPPLAERLQAIAQERRYSDLWAWLGIGMATEPSVAAEAGGRDAEIQEKR